MYTKYETVTIYAEATTTSSVGLIVEYLSNLKKVIIVDVTSIYNDYCATLHMEFNNTIDYKLFRLFQIITEIVTINHSSRSPTSVTLESIVEYVIEEVEYVVHEKYGFDLSKDIGLITTATEIILSTWDIAQTNMETGFFALPLRWDRKQNVILLHTGLITWNGALRWEE